MSNGRWSQLEPVHPQAQYPGPMPQGFQDLPANGPRILVDSMEHRRSLLDQVPGTGETASPEKVKGLFD
jgi:hypothetical protein